MRIGSSLALTRGGARAFAPAALFAGGAGGAWYDPSDMASLFQDTAGTVPVTASGQAVARISDKSGNGNHATQATAANRPVFQESGGLRWLEFDGVNDGLQSTFAAALAQPNTIWAAARATALPAAQVRHLFDGLTGARHCASINASTSILNQLADTPSLNASPALTGGTDFVSSHLFNGASSAIRIDNAGATAGNSGSQSLSGATIGARFNITLPWSGRIYGLLAVNGAAETQWGANMRGWMAARQGRTL